MNFEHDPEHKKLASDAYAFARATLKLRPDGGEIPRAQWKACADFGILGLPVPRDQGGLGLGALGTAVVLEELGRGADDLGFCFAMAAHMFACVCPVMDHGSDEQRRRYLPGLIDGSVIGANAITEAGAGTDAYALKTAAVRTATGYALTGTKSYVTNGPWADLFVVYGTVNPKHGFMGVSGFLIPRGTPGLTVGKGFEKMGLDGSSIGQLYLDGCEVTEAQRLGAEGGGAAIFTRSMLWERGCLFALYVGSTQALLDRTVAWAKERKQYKQSIGKFQAISHALADVKVRLEAARLLLYRACWAFDRGDDALLDISMSKLAISEGAVQAALAAIQIHGGMGYVTETGVERVLRDSVPSTIFSGTSEVHRNLIASRLGL